MNPPCKSPGTLINIGGKWWCIGEKLSSKSKYSKLNKSKKNKIASPKKKGNRTRRSAPKKTT